MADRFDEMARDLHGLRLSPVTLAQWLRKFHSETAATSSKRAQEAMRERAKARCEETADWMLNRGKSSHGAALCADRIAALPIEE